MSTWCHKKIKQKGQHSSWAKPERVLKMGSNAAWHKREMLACGRLSTYQWPSSIFRTVPATGPSIHHCPSAFLGRLGNFPVHETLSVCFLLRRLKGSSWRRNHDRPLLSCVNLDKSIELRPDEGHHLLMSDDSVICTDASCLFTAL